MPTYFFQMLSGERQADDTEGQELDSLQAAVEVAELSLCEIAGDALKGGAEVQIEAIIVADDKGQELARVSTEDVVLKRFRAFAESRRQ